MWGSSKLLNTDPIRIRIQNTALNRDKKNMNLRIKTESVTAGTNTTAYARILVIVCTCDSVQYIFCLQTIVSALTVAGSIIFVRRF